ncbi:MAG: hypothetical protein G01um101425_224 [Candidatus Peregrinibacteria bacterium Gr01-1014_25]|nr:MAG: hypothetical protein G01um101425_224 [Candidatus Peregrinibacteria bacterium Gr01-1014_25]
MRLRMLRTVALLVVTILPVPALAALTTPADVLGVIESDEHPHAYAVEIHAGADGTYVSLWGKGTHRGTIPALAAGQGTVTVDVVDHAQGINARIRLLYRLTGGTLYVSLEEIRGAFEDELAVLDLRMHGKKWLMIPLPQEFQTMDRAAAMTMLVDLLRGSGIDVGEEQTEALMDALANAAFSLTRSATPGGTDYILTLKPSFVDDVLRAGTAFILEMQGADPLLLRQALRDVLRDDDVAVLRAMFSSLHMTLRVRASGDVPSSWTLAGDWATEDFSMRLKGSSQHLATLPAVVAPANALLPEDFFAALSALWPMTDALPLPSIPSMPLSMMEAPSSDSMPPPSQWPVQPEGMATSMTASPCAPSTISGVNDLRKGQLCGRFTRIRRHLDQ